MHLAKFFSALRANVIIAAITRLPLLNDFVVAQSLNVVRHQYVPALALMWFSCSMGSVGLISLGSGTSSCLSRATSRVSAISNAPFTFRSLQPYMLQTSNPLSQEQSSSGTFRSHLWHVQYVYSRYERQSGMAYHPTFGSGAPGFTCFAGCTGTAGLVPGAPTLVVMPSTDAGATGAAPGYTVGLSLIKQFF